MIKVLAAARRRPTMTHAEFSHYLREVHAELIRKNPLRLDRYLQNHVFDGAFGKQGDSYPAFFHRDSVVELYFENLGALQQTFSDPYTRDVIAADGINFSDIPAAISMLATEHVLMPPRGTPPVKILHWLKRAGPPAGDALAWLDLAHEKALAAAPDFAPLLQGLAWNIALPAPGESGKPGEDHFGGDVMPHYDAVAALWLSDVADMPVYRRYERAFSEAAQLDETATFFVCAREIAILP